jgi:hypothetical protein
VPRLETQGRWDAVQAGRDARSASSRTSQQFTDGAERRQMAPPTSLGQQSTCRHCRAIIAHQEVRQHVP